MSTKTFQKHELTIELTLNLTPSMSTHPGKPVVYGTVEISAYRVTPFQAHVYRYIQSQDQQLVLDNCLDETWLSEAHYELEHDIAHLLQHLFRDQYQPHMPNDIIQHLQSHMSDWLNEQQVQNPAKVAPVIQMLEQVK